MLKCNTSTVEKQKRHNEDSIEIQENSKKNTMEVQEKYNTCCPTLTHWLACMLHHSLPRGLDETPWKLSFIRNSLEYSSVSPCLFVSINHSYMDSTKHLLDRFHSIAICWIFIVVLFVCFTLAWIPEDTFFLKVFIRSQTIDIHLCLVSQKLPTFLKI